MRPRRKRHGMLPDEFKLSLPEPSDVHGTRQTSLQTSPRDVQPFRVLFTSLGGKKG